MPDLLAHVLFAYGVCAFLSMRYDWLSAEYRTIGMVGALVPDLYKVYLLVPNATVEALVGVPFSWFALRTGSGVAVLVVLIAMAFVPGERRRGGAMLALGGGSHLVADLFLATPTGHAYPILWPLTTWRPVTPNLYQSTDPAVTAVFAAFALVAFAVAAVASDSTVGN